MNQKATSNSYDSDRLEDLKDKLLYIKSTIDPRYLLSDLGITIEKESGKELRGCCPIHKGDNSTSFRFNKDKRTWVCFSKKCHELHGNDIIGLIKGVTGKSFMEAVAYLQELTGDIGLSDYTEFKRNKEMDDFVNSNNDIKSVPRHVNQESLNKYKYLRSDFFIKEGFKKSTLDHFEIAGGWKGQDNIIRDIIPIRDDEGDLIAYSLRDTRNGVSYDDKYKLTYGFNKDRCLYNLDKAIPYLSNLPLILVEGFKSVWRLYEHGVYNVAAIMGSSITEGQKSLLLSYALNGVVLMLDNDEAGIIGTIKAMESLQNIIDVFPVFLQEVDEDGNGLDPADLPKDVALSYIDTYY